MRTEAGSGIRQEAIAKFFTAHPPEVDDPKDGDQGDDAPQVLVQDVPQPDPVTPPLTVQDGLEFVTPLEDDEDRLDAFHDESHVRYRHIDNVIDEEELVPGQAQRVLP
jgi:hypothetical protein